MEQIFCDKGLFRLGFNYYRIFKVFI